MRVKRRDIADKITEKKGREINADDLASFVEDRARIAGHPIFGNLSSDNSSNTVPAILLPPSQHNLLHDPRTRC